MDKTTLREEILKLSLTEMEGLRNWLEAVIEEAEIDIPQKPGREPLDQRRVGSTIYRLERVKCGKRQCKCAAGGIGHGPYWYGYQWIDGRVKSWYLGKAEPPS